MKPRPILLERAAPLLYWAMLIIALAILLRGHNEPGGGFIGGLVAVAASALLAILLNPAAALRRQPLVVESALRHGFEPTKAKVVESHSEAIALLKERMQEGDWVLVKGSRRMAMERIVESLKERRA